MVSGRQVNRGIARTVTGNNNDLHSQWLIKRWTTAEQNRHAWHVATNHHSMTTPRLVTKRSKEVKAVEVLQSHPICMMATVHANMAVASLLTLQWCFHE